MNDTLEWTERELSVYDGIIRTGGFDANPDIIWKCMGSVVLTKLWVEKGYDVNLTNEKGETPLIRVVRCVRKPFLVVMRLLLKHGARVNATSHANQTALDALLRQQYFFPPNPDFVRKQAVLLLLQHGGIAIQAWEPDTLVREFYLDVRSFLVLVNTNFPLPIDLLRALHMFIIG
jgi:ankyrin repeat protein